MKTLSSFPHPEQSVLRESGRKWCCSCHEIKLLTEFGISRKRPDGIASECKPCARIRVRSWGKKNKPKIKAWNDSCAARRRSSKDPRYIVKRKLDATRFLAKARDYVPCLATVDELALVFTTVCQVCDTECGRKICIDHCHDTGKFRGFICNNCNTVLGYARDDADHLRKLVLYLEQVSV